MWHSKLLACMIAAPVLLCAEAMIQRSKTDRLDAEVLRQFAARMPFVACRPPSTTALKLVAVARRHEALTDLLAAEKNRRHAAKWEVGSATNDCFGAAEGPPLTPAGSPKTVFIKGKQVYLVPGSEFS